VYVLPVLVRSVCVIMCVCHVLHCMLRQRSFHVWCCGAFRYDCSGGNCWCYCETSCDCMNDTGESSTLMGVGNELSTEACAFSMSYVGRMTHAHIAHTITAAAAAAAAAAATTTSTHTCAREDPVAHSAVKVTGSRNASAGRYSF